MTIVMGMDQHRAQITAEWIDTITGEISTARIAPADRTTVRRFLARFDGEGLEVALEATTGWRFVVEELQRVGAEAHLAEPAETSGLKGKKRRAKTDWADARHLRELLLIGRLPESWIAPAHLLDLRARVRCRHTLVEQRTEWQQRMHAVLYHHRVPHSRKLLTLANRERIAALKLPNAAREQLTIALEMIDAIDVQIGPVDLALRTYARQHPGCRTLIDQIYGIGPLTSVAIVAELGDTRRFQNSRDAVRYSGLDRLPVRHPTLGRTPLAPRTTRAALGALRGSASRPAPKQPRPALLRPTRRADRRKPRVHRCRPQTAQTQLPPLTQPRRSRPRARHHLTVTRRAPRSPMNRGQFPTPCCRPSPERPRKTERPQPICRNTPPHHVPDR